MVEIEIVTAVTFAITAGIATFFSPCAAALLPGYVGFYASQTDDPTLGGTVARGLVAAIGAIVTLAVLLGVTFWIGHQAFSDLLVLEPIVGVALLVFGLLVLSGRAPSLSVTLPQRRSSVLGFGVFGAGYAVAAAGCVAPVFLSVIVQALSFSPGGAAVVLGSYVGVIALLMLSLTVVTGMGMLVGSDAASAGGLTAYSHRLEQLAGVVMILAGLGQLYIAFAVSSPV